MSDLRWRTRSAVIVAALTTALTGACSSSVEPPQQMPATLEAITATSITGTVGTDVTPAPSVRVTDQNGKPVRGVSVTFLRSARGAAVLPNTLRQTDIDGVATIDRWTLGIAVEAYTLTARAAGLGDVLFVATAAAGPVARMTPVSGSDQREAAGTTLPVPLQVRVADAFDNVAAGATVTFTVLTGGGSLAANTAVANFEGVVTSGAWTLGAAVGHQRVQAHAGNQVIQFSAEACGAGAPCEPLPPLPPLPGMLAFVSERDGNSEIYVMKPDGTGLLRLTDNAGRDADPAWSPDGKRIAFASNRAGNSDIYVMDADGSNLLRRTQTGSSDAPAWSPDGKQIAFSSLRDGQFGIYVMSVDGDWANPTQVGHDRGWNAHPAWTPDGKQISFVSDWRAFDFVFDVYVMNADGSNITTLLEGPFSWTDGLRFYFQPSWSPDGKKIAVVVCEHAWDNCYPSSSIAIANADGSGLTTLVQTGGFARPTWSPDGSTIAFASQTCRACVSSLRYVSTDGSSGGLILSNAHSPAWRP